MAYDQSLLNQSGNPYAMTRGVIPTPGTPAYEQMMANVMNAKEQAGLSQGQLADTQRNAVNSYNTLLGNTGTSFGMMDRALARQGLSGGSIGGLGGAGGSSSSGGSSSMTSGAGLLDEILGLIRGTGDKQMGAARRRLTEDYGTATDKKMNDLARRGLFRAGIGEKEMLEEVDKPFSRGQSDLASNLYDAQVDTSLRKASILGDIEAQARKAQAEKYAQAAQTGTGAYTINPSAGGGSKSSSSGGDSGGGGIFGAQFVEARSGYNPNAQPGEKMYTPQQIQAGLKSGSMSYLFPQGSGGSTGTNTYGGAGSGDTYGGGFSVPQLGPASTSRYNAGTNMYTGQSGYRDTRTGAWVTPQQAGMQTGTVAPNTMQSF